MDISVFSRYKHQVLLPGVGQEGQERLFKAKTLVVGAGGLGSPILYYLAAAGVGTLGIIDEDKVDISNLQRQILHWEKDVGTSKVDSAREKLNSLNSRTKLIIYESRLGPALARELFPDYDLVISAVDNRATRLVINKVCYETGRPWVEGGVNRFTGVVTVFNPPEGPCYQCLYGDIIDAEKSTPAILGTVAGVIGLLQAQEALKLILGIGKPLTGRLLIFDALETAFESVEIKPDPKCRVCGR